MGQGAVAPAHGAKTGQKTGQLFLNSVRFFLSGFFVTRFTKKPDSAERVRFLSGFLSGFFVTRFTSVAPWRAPRPLPCHPVVRHKPGRRHRETLVLLRPGDFIEWFGPPGWPAGGPSALGPAEERGDAGEG